MPLYDHLASTKNEVEPTPEPAEIDPYFAYLRRQNLDQYIACLRRQNLRLVKTEHCGTAQTPWYRLERIESLE